MIICVVGTRPNFVKMAALLPALREPPDPLPVRLVHTGQHYDATMKDAFFRQLQLPEPDVDLGVGPGSHAQQTAAIMQRFEPVVEECGPQAVVLVVGDVNSTLACALTAAKMNLPVIHVEAGLRSFDRTMPEEINRVVTDQLSSLLFTTEREAEAQLLREGILPERIFFTGNVMIDTLRRLIPAAPSPGQIVAATTSWSPPASGYAVVTLHRPGNVDDPGQLSRLLELLAGWHDRLPMLFPVHPRTRERIQAAGLAPLLQRLIPLPPLGYLEMIGLLNGARLVLTDSGGIQEETTALGVPCLTLREETERPVTVREGTNRVVGTDPEVVSAAIGEVLANGGGRGRLPELWDGQAALRIARIIKDRYRG